jgi:RNA polymerase sigma factor (sigma-70 family)
MNDKLTLARTELLVLQLRRGKTEAFADLVALWERRLFYYIRRLVPGEEDAWDVLQETWIKAHARLRQLRDSAAFPAWIYAVARNCAVSHLRSQERHELLREDERYQTAQDESVEVVFRADQAERIHLALARLPMPQREAATLFFLEGFSLIEIGAIARVSVGTVKSRLFYARKTLRAMLESEVACDA